MFLVWRGAASLVTLVIVVACMLPSVLIGNSLDPVRHGLGLLCAGMGAVLAGVASWFYGVLINRKQPQRRLDDFVAHRSYQLHALADQGQFHLGPGHAAPRSMQEAHEQADQLLSVEKRDLSARLFDHNHLWFIPVQYLGPLIGGVGVLVIIVGIVRLLSV